MRKLLVVMAAAVLVAMGARGAQAQPTTYVQGPFGPGGTWNVYEFFTDTLTWYDASLTAEDYDFDGVTGHLVDVLSAEENAWLSVVGGGGDWWIGLTDREGAAPQLNQNGALSPQESEGLSNDQLQGWAWTSGKPVTYTNWNGGEPNDSGGEDAVHLTGSAVWNDHKSGMDLDEPIVPTIRPGTSGDEFSAQQLFRYIVEYPLEAGDPIDGVDAPGLTPLCPELPGALGTNGQVAVTDFYGNLGTVSGIVNVCNIIDGILDTSIEPDLVVTQDYRITDVTDPDTNVGGGPILGGTPLPFPSDTPGVDDNSFLSIAKGTFTVDEAGTYTIQVRSDDGMGFRVNGTPFTSVAGAGYKDDNGAMVMALDTGDANTRGVIDLAAGEHSFEFMMWENGGGAYWEITKSKGANTNVATAQWTPLVDLDNIAVGAMPKDLQGVDGGEGTIGVTDYYGGLGTISGLATAASVYEQIAAGDLEPEEIATAQQTISAARDPDTNGGTTILGGAAPAFPSDVPGTDDNDFLSIAKGTVLVPEDGTYTIQVRSDDGMGFRMIGTPFTSVHGNGQLDVDGAIVHPADTGDSNTRGVIELTKGQHQFEFLMWERGGGAFWEITSSEGAHPEQATGTWRSLGDVEPEISVSGPGVARMVGNANVIQNMESGDSGGGTPYLEITIDDIDNAPPGSPTRSDVSTVLISDQVDYARPSQYVQGEKFRFPANEGNNTDFNNFSTGIFGQLQIDDGDATPNETIQVTFGMFTDDHSAFRIVGQDFDAVGGDVNTSLFEIEGDFALAFDLPTGNSNALGVITLQEGVTYDFEGYQHENGGGANYEIWAAPGDQTGFDLGDLEAFLTTFYPLSSAAPDIFRAGGGLALVAYNPLRGDFNGNGAYDVEDIDILTAQSASNANLQEYDLTGDGLVNQADVNEWAKAKDIGYTWIGDANFDGQFNTGDFVQVLGIGKYEQVGATAVWSEGDWNGDGVFGTGDLVAALSDGGYEIGPRTDVSAVPEPSAIVLSLLGLAGLLGLSRRRQG